MDAIPTNYVERLVNEGNTYLQISRKLQNENPNQRGLSERSVRRYCKERGISMRSGLDDDALDGLVEDSVRKVGPAWGRKMVHGFLRAHSGVSVAERRVGASLARVSPGYHQYRQTRTELQTNPVPYCAEYFGHKLHIDQNEKLEMYGVTHVCAVDGYSGKVVSHALMPVKNNLLIYEHIYRSSVAAYGMWDQLRVDKGREFSLTLFVQDALSNYRRNTVRLPYIQSTSKANHRVERMWVEMNQRVNYPIKRALNSMVNAELLDMDDHITQFAVSWVTLRVCQTGCRQVIDSWNNHRIPGRGTPNDLQMENNKANALPADVLPVTDEAVRMYEEDGGHLTHWPEFGLDPLASTEQLATNRLTVFNERFPRMNDIFHAVVNDDVTSFQNAVTLFRDLTKNLCE